MSKKDLTKNPMDDYVAGPSVLDKASALIAEQVGRIAESLAKAEDDNSISDKQHQILDIHEEGVSAARDEIYNVSHKPTTTHTIRRGNPFSDTCPDFGLGDVKQAMLEQQWSICGNRWSFQQTDTSMSVLASEDLQMVIFAAVVAMMKKLSVEHFVAIQPTEYESTKLFFMQHCDTGVDDNGWQTGELNIVTAAVDTLKRKLHATLTMELFQDMRAFRVDDLMYEVVQMLSHELVNELYKEIYTNLCGTDHKVVLKFETDDHTSTQLYKESIDVAKRSSRGKANKMILSNSVLASLLRAEAITVDDDQDKRYGHVSYVGNMGHDVEIFNDASMPNGEALVLYKGPSQADSGLIYVPHKMLVSGGMSVSPTTFQPSMSLFTQYAIYKNHMSNYVSHVTITDIGYNFDDDKMITELFKEKPLQSAFVEAASFYSPYMPLGREVR